ncbi:hypothetical protein QBC42DRAFT_263279 [Cladorrhinum samala]|uniref:Uncharacterized protein n=1 Tax=Cladorrhinum samala TaxID=585594 RepID=A0AAV9HUQ9_9PEZI|nr:hypothetical protein QBC42DRAFT_263279 [Cladorrhinum samala]
MSFSFSFFRFLGYFGYYYLGGVVSYPLVPVFFGGRGGLVFDTPLTILLFIFLSCSLASWIPIYWEG